MDVNKKIVKLIIKAFIITVILELTLFNFRHWESCFFPETKQPLIEAGEGIEKINASTYMITDTNKAFINFTGIHDTLKNIYLPIKPQNGLITNISIYADDAANANGVNLGDTTIVSSVQQSNYLRLHLSGLSNYVRIKVNQENNFVFSLDSPAVNMRVPIMLSWIRIVGVFIVCIFAMFFSPKSEIYKESLSLDKKWKKIALFIFVLFHVLVIGIIGNLVDPDHSIQYYIDSEEWPAHGQYNELADAIIEGQVYLDRKPPESLKLAKNPYDTNLRWKTVNAMGQKYDVDYAYFENKYYSYFGPAPAILFFVPYKLLTGNDCATWAVVTICTMLFCIAIFYLLYVCGVRYFKTVSYGIYLLMSSFLFWGSGAVYLVYTGNVYSMPIICGLFLGTLGLALWVSASKNGKLMKSHLILGAFCIALIIGCRPQLAIILFLAFTIFWKEIVKERAFFSKKGLLNTLLVIVPFLIIGCSMMWYNYARFHSPFDFGANYNLTSNDMTHRGIVFDRFFLGIFCYLLQPLNIVPKYPFMHIVDTSNDYLGFTNLEPLFGGFFVINSLALCSLLVLKMKRKLKEHRIYAMTATCMIMAAIIMLLDIQMAGLTQRYMSDFGWLIILSAIFIIFLLEEVSRTHCLQGVFYRIISIFTGLCICLNLWTLLIPERYFNLVSIRPTLFYMIKYLLFFE